MADQELNNFLIKAIKNNDLSTVVEALDAGADVNYESGFMRRRPLHYAVYDESGQILKELLKRGAETDVFDESGFTPLHDAVMVGQFINAEFLLEHGADINAQASILNMTPLHSAYYQDMLGNANLRVQFLLSNGADLHKTVLRGEKGEKTVLDLARESGDPHSNSLLQLMKKFLKGENEKDACEEETAARDMVTAEQKKLREKLHPYKHKFQIRK